MMFRRLAAFAFLALASLFAMPHAGLAAQGSGCMPTTGTVSGLSLVNDINAGLAALISSNSGAAAPTTDCSNAAVIGQVWFDTSVSPPRLRIYGGSNGWREIGALDNANSAWIAPLGSGSASVASASTTDVCSTPATNIGVTGSATIGSFGSSCSPGQMKFLVFSPGITLVNSSQIVLPGGANITTLSGDSALAVYNGSGWNLIDYSIATGGPVTGSLPNGSFVASSTADAIFYISGPTSHFAQSVYQINGVNQSAVGTAPFEPFFIFDSTNNQNVIGCDVSGNCSVGEPGKTLTLNGFAAASPVPVRQTVLSGPLSAGLPNFLPATSASLSITTTGVSSSSPLVATAAGGFGIGGAIDVVGSSTANLTWSSLTASTTDYLGVTIASGALTPFSTTLVPIYQYGGTISHTNGQYTFDISQMQMFKGNGSTAPAVEAVFVGEVVTSGSAVTSAIEYAYQRRYHYQDTGNLPGSNANVSQNCNLGIHALASGGAVGLKALLSVYFVSNNVLSAGSVATIGLSTQNSSVENPVTPWTDGMSVGFSLGNGVPWFINGAGINVSTARYILDVTTDW